MPTDDLHQTGPLGKAFLDQLQSEFPPKPRTIKEQLKEMDQIIAVEENYLDKPASRSIRRDITIEEADRENYREYRDRKKWLDEE